MALELDPVADARHLAALWIMATGNAAAASGARAPATPGAAPLCCLLSAAHPADDLRVVRKEGFAIAAAGWRVLHLCPAPGDTLGDAPARIGPVAVQGFVRRRGWRGRVLGIPALARRAARTGARVFHASEPDSWLAALIAARLPGPSRGARVVLDVHEHYPSRLDPRLPAALRPAARGALRLLCRLAASAADAVVVAKDGLDGDFAAPDRTIAVRNYALPIAVVPRRHAPGPLTLVHLGALGVARGWPAMLDALALCPPGTRLRLIGRFTDGSEPQFLERAAALGLADRVERLGWMPHAEALCRAAECDIGLVLFQHGIENHRLALPHKLFDCMLAGLPVLAPHFAEEVAAILRDAECGALVDPGDPASIAAAVAALADPARRAAQGAAGREAALSRYGWAAEAARLQELYARLG